MSHLESRWHHCMKFGICKNVLDFDAKTSEGTFEKNRYTWKVSFCPRKLFAHGAGSFGFLFIFKIWVFLLLGLVYETGEG